MKPETLVTLILAVAPCIWASSLQCREGMRKPLTGNCNAFSECVNQNWLIKQCDSRFSFDPDKETCRPGWLVNCQNAPRTCSKPGEKMEVPGDCARYYKCLEDGQVVKESCSIFQRFDINSSSCLWSYKVDCNNHMECSTSIKFPVKYNNRKFTVCQGGRIITQTCPAGKFFDPENNDCLDPSSSKIQELEVPTCKEGILQPIEGNCNMYYSCTGGKLQENKCWWFQRFNPKSLKCEIFWDVECTQDNQCKDGDSKPMRNCSDYYSCENGKWEVKNCGTQLDLQLHFDAPSRECLMYNAVCYKGECAIEGMKELFPGDCSKYRVCRKGQLIVESCGWLQKFDTNTRECRYIGVDCTSKQDMTVCTDGQREPVDESCYSFKECVQGKFETKYCFYPMYRFDRRSSSCRFMASCDKQCESGETQPVPGRCDQYYLCNNGKYAVQTCLNGRYYDVVTSQCVESIQATCGSVNSKRSRGKRDLTCYYPMKLIDPVDCSKYLECAKGQWRRRNCGYLQKFDPSSESCQFATSCFMSPSQPTVNTPDTLVPVTKLESPTTKKYTSITIHHSTQRTPSTTTSSTDPSSSSIDPPTARPGCTPGQAKSINSSCTDYLLCDKNSNWVLQSCSTWCKNFDPRSSKCVWRWKYPCSKNTAECKEGVMKADSKDCKQYYLCVSGKYQLRSCSFLHKFNKDKLDCEFSFNPWC